MFSLPGRQGLDKLNKILNTKWALKRKQYKCQSSCFGMLIIKTIKMYWFGHTV